VVRDVIEHNDRIAAARFMETASRARVSPAGAWDDPMLMVGVTNLPTSFDFKMDPMTMTMIGVSQTIPYAGDKGLQADAARADAEVATHDRYALEAELARAARYAFADLYFRTRILDDLLAQGSLLQTVARAAQAKLATNQAQQQEALAAQAEVWRLQARVLEAEHMVDEARYNLNLLRGMDVQAEIPPLAAPAAIELPAAPDTWLAAATQHYPPLQKLSSQSEAYRLSSAAEGRMRWPMLQLSAYYGFRYDSEMEPRDDMIGFSASFPLPLFGLGKKKQMSAAMDAMRQGVDAEVTQSVRELDARLRLLHTTAVHLEYTQTLYRDRIIPTAQSAFQSALAGYVANQVPYTDLLMLAADVFRDRLELNETGNQLARTLAEVQSLTDDPRAATSEGTAQAP
jgi:outer membrane protein TolC